MAFLNVSDNQLEGQLSSSFWTLGGGSATTQSYWAVSFANNQLSGTVPSDFFDTLSLGYTGASHILDFSGNQLSGNIPNKMLTGSGITSTSLLVNFSSNPLMTGSIPSTFMPSIVDAATSSYPLAITIDVSTQVSLAPLRFLTCLMRPI